MIAVTCVISMGYFPAQISR